MKNVFHDQQLLYFKKKIQSHHCLCNESPDGSFKIRHLISKSTYENLYPSETKPLSHGFALLTFIHSNIQVCKFLQFYSLFETLLYDEGFRNERLIFL